MCTLLGVYNTSIKIKEKAQAVPSLMCSLVGAIGTPGEFTEGVYQQRLGWGRKGTMKYELDSLGSPSDPSWFVGHLDFQGLVPSSRSLCVHVRESFSLSVCACVSDLRFYTLAPNTESLNQQLHWRCYHPWSKYMKQLVNGSCFSCTLGSPVGPLTLLVHF